MADVNPEIIGGIGISITGDYSSLQSAYTTVVGLSQSAGEDISDALVKGGAAGADLGDAIAQGLSPIVSASEDASGSLGALADSIDAAQGPTADLSDSAEAASASVASVGDAADTASGSVGRISRTPVVSHQVLARIDIDILRNAAAAIFAPPIEPVIGDCHFSATSTARNL